MKSGIVRNFDFAKFRELRTRLEGMADKEVVVGVTRASAGRHQTGEINNAELLAVHEFGSKDGSIPERAPVRSSMSKHQDKYVATHAENLRKVVRGEMPFDKSLDLLGLRAAADVQQNIRDGDFKPLKQATINRKGSSTPLIDTGNLRQSITHEVRDA
ncbi:MAG: hypothetical protein KA735_04830 [Burkholderiaceae bacterium]|nr:hypothetical protein [Burkholderiaceae bacterium]